MNTKNKILAGLFSMAALFSSCNDFQEINEDPNQVDESKVKPEWFLNASIVGDQMNPEIAERMFILTWNRASRFNRGSGFTIGTDNNDYITRYLSNDYAVKWLNQATKAVQLGEKKVADGEADLYPYYKNVIQMARIWRAYLNSEVSDGFDSGVGCFFGRSGRVRQCRSDLYFYSQRTKGGGSRARPVN